MCKLIVLIEEEWSSAAPVVYMNERVVVLVALLEIMFFPDNNGFFLGRHFL